MPEIAALGEALVEVMRTGLDQGLDRPGPFVGPYPSGAPAIFVDAAARLGARSGFVGSVGDDAFGDCITHRLRLDRVDCSALRRDPARVTGIAFVSYRSDGSRRFLFHLADSAAAQLTLDQIPPGWLDNVRYLHITGSSLSAGAEMRETCYAVARLVAARGGTVSLDPNLRPELIAPERIRTVCEPVLACACIVFPSGVELTTLTGEASAEAGAAQLLQRGIEIVALKRGDQGSTIYTREGSLLVAPYTVTEVDPTGAGDCYDAAFVVGLMEGWDLARIGRFANAAGALATTRQGPMEGAHTRAQVLQFMQEAGRQM
jgi:sugar/nucleoside kinase (ribokinase family)